jgi:N-acetylated-alpha-linked acidic dipeptidase
MCIIVTPIKLIDANVFIQIAVAITVVVVAAGLITGLILWMKMDHPNYQQMIFDVIKPDGAKDTIKELSSYPHIAGSPENYQAAEWVQQKFKEFGLENTWMESYPVLLNYPLSRVVELVGGAAENYSCVMEEKSYQSIDGTSGDPRAIPTFNGYSASGNVTAELVYANYGRIEDYLYLDAKNISVKDKIVIVRYDKIFRADKVHMAEKRGAKGVLIYSDPADEAKGAVYPDGPWRAPTSVQRGTVWIGNGDPTTPGYPSTPNSPRLTLDEARDPAKNLNTPLPTIPVQPLSYSDAEPLLRAIAGNNIPSGDWQGGLNFTYHIGPGPAVVYMNIQLNFTVINIYNVFAKIQGTVEDDRLVLAGGHRDAWTFGAGDPISGTATLLEAARGLGKIYSQGWKPRRTILLCSWDAEEYGLVGSVEFAEKHFKTLTERAIAYLNVDIGVSGTDFLTAAGTPNLRQMMVDITKAVPGPTVNDVPTTMYELWSKYGNDSRTQLPVFDALGSGSDYTSFLQHVGIPSMHIQFDSADGKYEGVYHSNYDSFYWYTHWGDPTFEYHASLAKVFGLIVKTLSESVVIPFNYNDYAGDLIAFVDELEKGAASKFNKTFSEFKILQDSLNTFQVCAKSVEDTVSKYVSLAKNERDYELEIRKLNDLLMLTERAFIDYNGLPNRPFFRHIVYAPSQYDSYFGQAFPAISDAIFTADEESLIWALKYNSLFIDGASSFLCYQKYDF